ncbi:uncharacterized protein LOC130732744 [Lotus japonicus]|uniref:uncharacterized protein LOC130732744 n=1 Tax=Lotus japonicus TaxID=34305 RepID=UPI0025912B50|nr:uncharacterized protein LOC130732744 [Lotus japonicus]
MLEIGIGLKSHPHSVTVKEGRKKLRAKRDASTLGSAATGSSRRYLQLYMQPSIFLFVLSVLLLSSGELLWPIVWWTTSWASWAWILITDLSFVQMASGMVDDDGLLLATPIVSASFAFKSDKLLGCVNDIATYQLHIMPGF